MSINKCFFDFHLLEEGWVSTPPYDEGSPSSEPPGESLVMLRMIEFSYDDKPDIWYKAEINHVDFDKTKVAELISKHGLPPVILVNCLSQKQELEQLLARFS